ncbi:MAG: glycosyltransferase family 2 protein [Phycisphaerae bacterium]
MSDGVRQLRFSVVVPTYNRPERLRRCVSALAAMEYPRDRFEVVIVDDGSPQPAEPVVQQAAAEAGEGFQVRLVRQANAGPAAARNRGAAEATGEVLAFTDDDCEPAADWLTRLDVRIGDNPALMVGGRLVNALPDDLFAEASQQITEFVYDWAERLGHGTGPDDAYVFATANLACGREAFCAVGGFDETFPLAAGEDHDFSHKYQFAGHPAAFDGSAVVHHWHAMSLREFCRQHVAYGRGLLHFIRRVSLRSDNARHRLPGSFQARLAWYGLRRCRRPRDVAVFALVQLSQAATLLGALKEARDRPAGKALAAASSSSGGGTCVS